MICKIAPPGRSSNQHAVRPREQGRRKAREKERRRAHEARCTAEDQERDAIAAALPALLARALGVAVPAASAGLPMLQPTLSGAPPAHSSRRSPCGCPDRKAEGPFASNRAGYPRLQQ